MQLKSLHDLDRTEGTVQMREPSGTSEESKLVLIPHPSPTDPNDPLRWPRWKKHVAFFAVCAFTFMANYGIGGLSPAFYIISLQFDKTQSETSALLIWPILVFGVFNFFWVPMANYIGKRPVFVFASGLLCLCYVWGAVATTFRSLLWSNIVAAAAGSSTEALGAAMVNDLYFLHERSTKMSIYMLAISGGNTIGPLICGFVVQGLDWRWHKWMAAIFTFVFCFLLVALFVPETRYYRDYSASLDATPTARHALSMSMDEERTAPPEKTLSSKTAEITSSDSLTSEGAQLPKKTWAQGLTLWTGTNPNTSLLKLFLRPFPLIVYPAVILSFLGYAVSLAWVVAVNIFNSFILASPPYNFNSDAIGAFNVPGFIGNLVGSFAGGWVVDRYCDWRARKNGGVFQPETRLVMLIIPAILAPAGCVLFGYGAAEMLNWSTLFVGYGLIAVGLTAVPTITMTYVSDSYLPIAPDALLLVNGLKNVVAFGFLWGVGPWIAADGYISAFWTQAGIYLAIVAVGGAAMWWGGEYARHKTARWRIIL